jgi:predicted component of type VI protein secretion system
MSDYGLLIPRGGGEDIVLTKERILVGRHEKCDIVLRFPNVSSQHCRLALEQGYWFVKDLDSRNGTKVNGFRVTRKRVDPGAVISIAKHEYRIKYDPEKLGAMGPPPADDDVIENILRATLMERAGLQRRSNEEPSRNKPVDDEL